MQTLFFTAFEKKIIAVIFKYLDLAAAKRVSTESIKVKYPVLYCKSCFRITQAEAGEQSVTQTVSV